MKRIVFGLVFFALVSTTALAQTLGEFKPKDDSYGIKKAKNADKIYIAAFNVNYQLYNEKEDFKQGGRQLGGGMKGDAKASLSVGLEGLDAATVQGITDQLYEDYIGKLKAKGLTIVSADEAAKIESYEDFERVKGGTITMAEIPGVMTNSPTGYEYFVKGFKKDGKSKKGGFLGNPTMMYPKISKDLGDVIVGRVDLTVLFVQDQNAFQGSGANIKVKTNLRLIGVESVVMASDAKIKMKGQNDIIMVTSNVSFYHGKVGAGATTVYSGTLGKPLYINDVIESDKVQSFARGGMSAGTSTIYGTFYSVRNQESSNAKIINVDPQKYKEGVYAAAHKFLSHHTDAFLNDLKK